MFVGRLLRALIPRCFLELGLIKENGKNAFQGTKPLQSYNANKAHLRLAKHKKAPTFPEGLSS